jgi:hypothetical protein
MHHAIYPERGDSGLSGLARRPVMQRLTTRSFASNRDVVIT